MQKLYVDMRIGNELHRDREGADYEDVAAAEAEMREVVLEMARNDRAAHSEYELTLRDQLRPVRTVRLVISG